MLVMLGVDCRLSLVGWMDERAFVNEVASGVCF